MKTLTGLVLAVSASLLLQGCTPPSSGGGLLTDGPSIRSEGETCATGQLICLRQESTVSTSCPTKRGSRRTVTATSVKDGARVAVRFDLKLSPDEPLGSRSSEVRTFSAKQSTASLGCDFQEDNKKVARYVQVLYVCARTLADGEAEPSPSTMTCATPVPVFDPNTLPSKPLAVAISNETVIDIAFTAPDLVRVQAQTASGSASCRALCEDPNAGECVRLRVASSLYASIVAPALPTVAAPPGRFEKVKYMSSLGVSDDPCNRSDLNFQGSRFNNRGGSCAVTWSSPGIGNVGISLPAEVSAVVATSEGQSTMLFAQGKELSIQFADPDFGDLNGRVSQIEVSEVATYARLPAVCLSLKPSPSRIAMYSSLAHTVLASRASAFGRRAQAFIDDLTNVAQ